MRIRNIRIKQWRHFANIELEVDDDTGLVCIVGANGTGKSHLLELIAACAHKLGLAHGVEIPRGDPFADPHDFSLQFYFAAGVSDAIDEGLKKHDEFDNWSRTLTIQSIRSSQGVTTTIRAGGIDAANASESFGAEVVACIRDSNSVHFISLDADRAYPKKNINFNEVAQAYEIDWEGPEYTRGRSFKTTTTLYDEWLKYFLAQENQAGTRLIQSIRRARESGGVEPVFSDHFMGYKAALETVLPHVVFTGVNSKKRTLQFDTTGLELSFDQLSGGEREIAFLIGQIDRFGLTQGLFLLDEPELHLNADLIRSWVAYLTGTVETGQIWLATHSLEAVEAAGQHATFVLERNEVTRKVDNLARLDSRPVLSALSRAVGTPAFSISQLRFVFVEGDESVGERERFRRLAGLPHNIRFIECGSCDEVVRRVAAIRSLADESETGIRIGGVIDRDFRTAKEVVALLQDAAVYGLAVHEIENFFLHPPTLRSLLTQNGRPLLDPESLIRSASDARAGCWIFQRAMSTPSARFFPNIPLTAKECAKRMTWIQIASDKDLAIQAIVSLAAFGADDARALERLLTATVNSYERKRETSELWKLCEGKQVLNEVARSTGFAGAPALMLASFATWERPEDPIPDELIELRTYLQGL